jgi:hypothetical protein
MSPCDRCKIRRGPLVLSDKFGILVCKSCKKVDDEVVTYPEHREMAARLLIDRVSSKQDVLDWIATGKGHVGVKVEQLADRFNTIDNESYRRGFADAVKLVRRMDDGERGVSPYFDGLADGYKTAANTLETAMKMAEHAEEALGRGR